MTIVLFVGGVALLMLIIEIIHPDRHWKKVSGWWTRAIFLNSVQVGSVLIMALSLDTWMHEKYIWSIEPTLGVNSSALAGYFLITFIFYWWHRARHEIDFLWRWLHQIHHSPQRMEILTTFYKHPFEIIVNSLFTSTILYMILGLGPQAASYAILMTGLAELIYHWNVKTPYWLGFIFQRPESHCVHHQNNWHQNNYADLPLWDMMFGTFYNPKVFNKNCGFSDNKELRFSDMLEGVDVHANTGKDR